MLEADVKTDELIELLAQDATPHWPYRTVFLIAAIGGVSVSALAFCSFIGVRTDFVRALETVRFLFKFAITIFLAVGATGLALEMSCPGARRGQALKALAIAPVLLAGAVALELASVPSDTWEVRMIGHNARFCLTLIPLLSLGPLTCLIAALRHGAPTQPGLTGAVAGLGAAAIAATFYAANCDDDSPLFVALWYSIAFAMMSAAGYGLGRRFLTW